MKNILFIIGNGFDLRLGLPTSYPEFLDYYKHIEPISFEQGSTSYQNVKDAKELFFQKMKEKENSGNEEWKDLEVALGEFTSSLTDKEVFLDFYEDLYESLHTYLSNIEENSTSIFTPNLSKELIDSLLTPYNHLNARERRDFLNKVGDDILSANVISFNYTSSFELLSETTSIVNKEYERPDSQYKFILNPIKHVHGKLSKGKSRDILLGVDNETQITNKEFLTNNKILNALIKPKGNNNIGNLVDEDCLGIINEAKVIYIFGTSLGKTDQTWWTALSERFIADNEVVIVYFHFSKSSRPRRLADDSLKQESKEVLMTALGLESKNSDYRDRIFVAINSEMFPELPKRTYQRILEDKKLDDLISIETRSKSLSKNPFIKIPSFPILESLQSLSENPLIKMSSEPLIKTPYNTYK